MNTPTTGEIRPNSDQNPASGDSLPPTTGMDSVRFDHAEGGTVSISTGSSLSSLLTLGAMAKTRRYRPETGASATATDEAGREMLVNHLGGAVVAILDGLSSVGKALALASDELPPDDVFNIGWLVCGLAELAQDIRFERGEIQYEQGRGKGAESGPARQGGQHEKR
jgi:hypothetical protein